MSTKKIGVLTGGGDCPGLNAVIRAVVKTAISEYGWEVWGIHDGYEGLIDGRGMKLRSLDVSNILPIGGTILGTSNTANPFAYARWNRGKIVKKDMSKTALGWIRKWKLDALVAIGGDGTLSIANGLRKMGVPVVGIPKTIDNDLAATDMTFGHDTAVQVISDAIDRLHSTALSHHRVMVVEVMGRYAGWLALSGGLSGGGDVILLPEIPFSMEKVIDEVHRRQKFGRKFSIVVVSEGAREKGKDMVVRQIVENSHDPIRLGGIGSVVASEIEKKTGISSRIVVLGHLQRGGTPTAFDRLLATGFGVAAVHLIGNKKFGRMVALKGSRVVDVKIEDAVSKLKLVTPNIPMMKMARSIGTVFGE